MKWFWNRMPLFSFSYMHFQFSFNFFFNGFILSFMSSLSIDFYSVLRQFLTNGPSSLNFDYNIPFKKTIIPLRHFSFNSYLLGWTGVLCLLSSPYLAFKKEWKAIMEWLLMGTRQELKDEFQHHWPVLLSSKTSSPSR